jgi:large subunit ribosomal protein L4
VTFGPNLKKDFKRVVPKKMRRKALFMVLSAKAKENFVLVLENMNIEKPKTKPMFDMLNKICLKNGSALVVLPKNDLNLIKSIRNIEKTKVMQAKDLNVIDVLNYKHLVMPEDSIKVIKEVFAKSE